MPQLLLLHYKSSQNLVAWNHHCYMLMTRNSESTQWGWLVPVPACLGPCLGMLEGCSWLDSWGLESSECLFPHRSAAGLWWQEAPGCWWVCLGMGLSLEWCSFTAWQSQGSCTSYRASWAPRENVPANRVEAISLSCPPVGEAATSPLVFKVRAYRPLPLVGTLPKNLEVMTYLRKTVFRELLPNRLNITYCYNPFWVKRKFLTLNYHENCMSDRPHYFDILWNLCFSCATSLLWYVTEVIAGVL